MPSPVLVDRAVMQRLADLARLHLPADRLAALQDRLERILAAFSSLEQVAGSVPAPGSTAPTPLRADVAGAPLPIAAVLANAPKHAGGCFLVPRVVDA